MAPVTGREVVADEGLRGADPEVDRPGPAVMTARIATAPLGAHGLVVSRLGLGHGSTTTDFTVS